ncbi:hypothetical protein BDN70DRAFT_997394 [Pholiota conissans]|uniref:F-box domain-containing protein n=1 Tax=Pholiota conissans TaxID=109636 RepID=A0A9P5YU17_9AGAR|nr:hypothetical protein BDN70DRAFT_997394 [Pholiota conissans]
MSPRAQDLPYDIWEYITTFLPSAETKKLLDVNHALFDIAMNERYRTTTVGSLIQKETSRTLARLTDPEVASRVHKLIFKPGDICRAILAQKNAKRKTIASDTPKNEIKIRSIVKGSLLRQRMETPVDVHPPLIPADVAVTDILVAMKLLTGLTSLLVDINTSEHWYFHQANIPFFTIGWPTFRTSLQSLELRVPVEDLALILPKETLSNLEAVSFWVIRASISAQEDTIVVETILPFLQSHRLTLRSLTLDVAERTNLSPLLSELQLPFLTYFKLSQPYFEQGVADYTGLQRFFKRHRSSLLRLDIVVGHPSALSASQPYPFFSQECFSISLPHLEHLAIDYNFSDLYGGGVLRDAVINYIHRCKSTLTSLTLGSSQTWTLNSAKLLVEGFISTARLRRLEISVVFFESELLTVLAANLPNLEILKISMLNISPQGDEYNSRIGSRVPLFATEIATLFFPQWRLKNLNLQVTGAGPSAVHAVYYLERDECKAALLMALPNVEVFCGFGREEYYSL